MGVKDDIDSFLAAGDAAALQKIADSAPKAEAKQARRALHILASRGVKVPESRPAGEKVFRPAVAYFETECSVGSPDSQGTALVSIARAGRAGGLELFVAGLNARQGFEFAWDRAVGKKEYREFMAKDLSAGLSFCRVPKDDVVRLLAGARRTREALGQAVPQAAASLPADWLAELPARAPAADVPPVDTEALCAEPELRTWLPPRELLVELEARLHEADASPLLIDDKQKIERINAVLSEATAGYFDASTRKDYAWRLDVAAVVFEASGRSGSAAAARAAAAEIADDRLAIEGCGFGRMFLRRLFRIGPQTEPKPPTVAPPPERLIVTPGEFAAEMSRKKT